MSKSGPLRAVHSGQFTRESAPVRALHLSCDKWTILNKQAMGDACSLMHTQAGVHRESDFDWPPTGPNPLCHRDEKVARPRAMGV